MSTRQYIRRKHAQGMVAVQSCAFNKTERSEAAYSPTPKGVRHNKRLGG